MHQKFPSLEGRGDSCSRSKRATGFEADPADTEGAFTQLEQELLESLALDEFATADVVVEGIRKESLALDEFPTADVVVDGIRKD